MATMTFDTHAAIKGMKDSGVAESHAESIVAAIQMSERHGEDLVTKADLNAGLKDLEDRMIARMTILDQRMTIRLGLMIFAAAGLVIAAIKLF